jgi:hypothetical protein
MLMDVLTLYTTVVRTRYVTRYIIETRVWRVLPDGTRVLVKSFRSHVESMPVPPETRLQQSRAAQPVEEAETV